MIALCIKIFFVRIVEVSFSTVKTIFIVRNKKLQSAIAGFCEMFIWYLVISEAINNGGSSIYIALAYGAGYGAGTFIGGMISDKFIKGNFTIQVITRNYDLIEYLKSKEFGVTVVNIDNDEDYKYMLFIEIYKNHYYELKKRIKKMDPNAFIVANETRSVYNGYMKK